MHHYTRFEETPLDTNMHQVHRDYHPAFKQGFSYEYLGVLGHSLNHVDFFQRPEADAKNGRDQKRCEGKFNRRGQSLGDIETDRTILRIMLEKQFSEV